MVSAGSNPAASAPGISLACRLRANFDSSMELPTMKDLIEASEEQFVIERLEEASKVKNSLSEEAVARGTFDRLSRVGNGERIEAILREEEVPPSRLERWVEGLDDERLDELREHFVAESEALHDRMERLERLDEDRDELWWGDLKRLLHQRDDLESLRRVLIEAGVDPPQVTESVDQRGREFREKYDLDLMASARLRRAAIGHPEVWWTPDK